ncbi:hypothetical protein ACFV9C_40940 [Kribbella sp. NPDC059898]|uniref:hypothetical protein n=1 Tax=Kribbella sp. NPDC059898 TaxID=3346995 RepID=UPI003665B4D4
MTNPFDEESAKDQPEEAEGLTAAKKSGGDIESRKSGGDIEFAADTEPGTEPGTESGGDIESGGETTDSGGDIE